MVESEDIANRLAECRLLDGANIQQIVDTLRDGKILVIRNRTNGVQVIGAYPVGRNLSTYFTPDQIRE